jgi:hypothetical protein
LSASFKHSNIQTFKHSNVGRVSSNAMAITLGLWMQYPKVPNQQIKNSSEFGFLPNDLQPMIKLKAI